MATADQITELRLEIQELVDAAPYTDEFLSAMIDTHGMTDAAYRIWISKRNAVAKLVDISEGGSSRKMSQLYDNYNKIVAGYENGGGVTPEAGRAPRTRAITRV